MELQDVLFDSQLLTVEVKSEDRLCHFLLVGPPAPDSLFRVSFYGLKDAIAFFEIFFSTAVVRYP